jgi:hypothetical protein
MLRWLAKLATGKSERKQLRDRAYETGAASVSILLQQEKHTDLHAVFSASNLAGDLIREEKRYQDGLQWMRESSTLLVRMAGKKKLPKTILYLLLRYQMRYHFLFHITSLYSTKNTGNPKTEFCCSCQPGRSYVG